MSSIEEYMGEGLNIETLIGNITENHTDSTFWYELFQATESSDTTVAGLNLPGFDDLSNVYHGNDASIFALNQAIHFCVDDNLRSHYISAKCLHLSMLHGELNYDYNISAPHLPFLNAVLELNPYHLAAVEAKISILESNPQQDEYNLYEEWVLANITNLTMPALPEGLQTERIGGSPEDVPLLLYALMDFVGYDYGAAAAPEEVPVPLAGNSAE